MTLLRTLMLLALIVWIGGIIFFAFVLAPTLFTVLPNTQLAGNVVSPALSKLHGMGLISGAVFLLASVIYNWQKFLRLRLFTASHIFVLLMMGLTAYSQFVITPRLREVRAKLEMVQEPGYEPYVPGTLPSIITGYRRRFNDLHAWSTRSEGAVLLLGLVVTVLTARRFGTSN